MRTVVSRLLALPAVLLVAACAVDAPSAPATVSAAGTLPLAAKSSPAVTGTLLACPTDVGVEGSATIGRDGGTLTVDGYSLVVPAGAVPRETEFRISAPASQVLEVEISADKRKDYKFKAPVTVTLSYARCADSALPADALTAWWIDAATKSKLGEMPATDDRAARTITFSTDHLSGYAIAYRNGGGNDQGENEGR